MTRLFAAHALLPDGWVTDLSLEIDAAGRIAALSANAAAAPGDERVSYLVPALGNLHSHTFQRAMAGMTERRGSGEDSFWSWRNLMYQFLTVLEPDDVEAIAGLAFVEMLEAGYASVGEFHYLHHQADGGIYGNLAEMSARIIAAAAATGIGLTHLPVLYSYGGTAGKPLVGGQLRFGNDIERFARLVEGASRAVRSLGPDSTIGVAPHSLRAIVPSELRDVLSNFPDGPVHIHVAEQQAEVQQVAEWLGRRPVQYLLDEVGIDKRWCLIHATHMLGDEIAGVGASGAIVGLCPATEANLGDGIFPGKDFVARDGIFGIGTDSNINIGLSEELRLLEYGQRLQHQARNVLSEAHASVGEAMYRTAARGGAQALGRDSGAMRVGAWADLVAIDGTSPRLAALRPDQLIDGWLFAANDSVVTDVWSAGRHNVMSGRHIARTAIEARYRATMAKIITRL